jgi:hypothetical protein
MQLESPRPIFQKFSNIKSNENPSSCSPSYSMRTERRTDIMKLIIAFLSFANGRKRKKMRPSNTIRKSGGSKLQTRGRKIKTKTRKVSITFTYHLPLFWKQILLEEYVNDRYYLRNILTTYTVVPTEETLVCVYCIFYLYSPGWWAIPPHFSKTSSHLILWQHNSQYSTQ